MTSEIQNTNEKKVYDLEERTALLGEGIIDFAKTLPHDRIRMIAKANPDRKKECKKIWQEAQELTLIFSTILNTSRKGK